jgi:hypothetical protein
LRQFKILKYAFQNQAQLMAKPPINFDTLLMDGTVTHFEELLSKTGVSRSVLKRNLNEALVSNHQLLSRLVGFLPQAAVLIDLAEQKVGKVTSENLMTINIATKEIVDSVSKPELEKFFREGMAKHINGETLSAPFKAVFDFTSGAFVEHLAETNNGSVSVVGRLNEEIILRSLRNSALSEGDDFQRTGQKSDADIIVSQKTGTKKNLYIEVKSYHARERLLRGLQDIPHPEKVGIGFFREPAEFNPQRTQTLINSNAWAIYLPDDTYEKVSNSSKSMTTSQQNYFYRPNSMFVGDMEQFNKSGQLRPFRNQTLVG